MKTAERKATPRYSAEELKIGAWMSLLESIVRAADRLIEAEDVKGLRDIIDIAQKMLGAFSRENAPGIFIEHFANRIEEIQDAISAFQMDIPAAEEVKPYEKLAREFGLEIPA